MQVYCEMINLARAQDRRAHMTEELARAGIEAQFFPAYDFKNDPADIMQARCNAEGPWGVFHVPNRAVTISHVMAWERFLETDAEHCLIMEDDIFISPEMGAWIDDLSWWPQDADIVKFERWRAHRLRVLLEKGGRTHKGRRIVRMLSRHMGAAAYMMTRDAAKRLVASEPYDMVVDHILFNINASHAARDMKIYQILPAMVEQGNEPPNALVYMGQRVRPTGMALLRQKAKRLFYEFAYPPSTIQKALTGKAGLARITFEPNVLAPNAAAQGND